MELTLAPHQVSSYEGIIRTLNDTMFYYDPSGTGEGKTEIALYAAKTCNLQLFVISPANVVPVWQARAYRYGLADHLIHVKSYDTVIMRGNNCQRYPGLQMRTQAKVSNSELKKALERLRAGGYIFNIRDFHDERVKTETDSLLLKRTVVSLSNFNQIEEYFAGGTNETPVPQYRTLNTYEVLEPLGDYRYQKFYLKNLVEGNNRFDGTLFIFDEAHYGRNATSSRCEYMSAITGYLMRYPTPHRSRFALLSASLFAIPNQTLGIYRMIGIMRENSYVVQKEVNSIFLSNLNRYLHSIGKHNVPPFSDIGDTLYEIWLKDIAPVVRNRTAFRQKQGMQFDVIVPSPSYMKDGQDYLNAYIEANLRALDNATRNMEDASTRGMTPTFDPKIVPHLVDRENFRVPLIWTIVNTILFVYLTAKRYSPNTAGELKQVVPKIVIGLSYHQKGGESTVSLAILAHFLQAFTTVCDFALINGATDDKQEELRVFNSSPRPGILLANIASIAEGVSIHDGAEPVEDPSKHYVRYVIVLADAFAVRDVQFKGRCDRYGNRSFPFMLTVYPRVHNQALETSIINKLIDRSVVFNEISGNYEEIDEQFLEGIKDDSMSMYQLEDKLQENRKRLTENRKEITLNIGDVKLHAELIDTSKIAIKLAGQNIQSYGIPVYTVDGKIEIINLGITNFFLNEYRESKGLPVLPDVRSYDWSEMASQLINSLPQRNLLNPVKASRKRIIQNYYDENDDDNPLKDYQYTPEGMLRI